ncbi:hypothetical protein [Paenibacillus ferrarius]|uniref:hypothetical protein n=1 Tax=Paenibacillus ferrarius TaxID=1469647 RepID=UPI003D28B5FB
MNWERYIGIDYAGRGEPHERTVGIQVVEIDREGRVQRMSPLGGSARSFSWSRQEVYTYLHTQLAVKKEQVIIGIDHNLSFPYSYFGEQGLRDWDDFLSHFVALWPTREQSVRACREQAPPYKNSTELRITETYTASAKSAWNFEQLTGAVSYSTHAGLPWIHALRTEAGSGLHIWPFDGWRPPAGTSVLAEVYPALLYQRYKHADDFPRDWPRDAQDAYVIAAWLRERDGNGTLARYFAADTLTAAEKAIAQRCEGWILGVC